MCVSRGPGEQRVDGHSALLRETMGSAVKNLRIRKMKMNKKPIGRIGVTVEHHGFP